MANFSQADPKQLEEAKKKEFSQADPKQLEEAKKKEFSKVVPVKQQPTTKISIAPAEQSSMSKKQIDTQLKQKAEETFERQRRVSKESEKYQTKEFQKETYEARNKILAQESKQRQFESKVKAYERDVKRFNLENRDDRNAYGQLLYRQRMLEEERQKLQASAEELVTSLEPYSKKVQDIQRLQKQQAGIDKYAKSNPYLQSTNGGLALDLSGEFNKPKPKPKSKIELASYEQVFGKQKDTPTALSKLEYKQPAMEYESYQALSGQVTPSIDDNVKPMKTEEYGKYFQYGKTGEMPLKVSKEKGFETAIDLKRTSGGEFLAGALGQAVSIVTFDKGFETALQKGGLSSELASGVAKTAGVGSLLLPVGGTVSTIGSGILKFTGGKVGGKVVGDVLVSGGKSLASAETLKTIPTIYGATYLTGLGTEKQRQLGTEDENYINKIESKYGGIQFGELDRVASSGLVGGEDETQLESIGKGLISSIPFGAKLTPDRLENSKKAISTYLQEQKGFSEKDAKGLADYYYEYRYGTLSGASATTILQSNIASELQTAKPISNILSKGAGKTITIEGVENINKKISLEVGKAGVREGAEIGIVEGATSNEPYSFVQGIGGGVLGGAFASGFQKITSKIQEQAFKKGKSGEFAQKGLSGYFYTTDPIEYVADRFATPLKKDVKEFALDITKSKTTQPTFKFSSSGKTEIPVKTRTQSFTIEKEFGKGISFEKTESLFTKGATETQSKSNIQTLQKAMGVKTSSFTNINVPTLTSTPTLSQTQTSIATLTKTEVPTLTTTATKTQTKINTATKTGPGAPFLPFGFGGFGSGKRSKIGVKINPLKSIAESTFSKNLNLGKVKDIRRVL